MGTKRRDAYAPRVGLDTNERAFNRNFWLEISEFSGKELLKRNFMDLDRKPIEERLLFLEHSHVKAEVFKESNEIKISATGPREIKVYLHERMMDLSKAVTITINGSKSRFEVKPLSRRFSNRRAATGVCSIPRRSR